MWILAFFCFLPPNVCREAGDLETRAVARYLGIKLYEARLVRQDCEAQDSCWKLELCYLRDIRAHWMGDAAADHIKKHFAQQYKAFEPYLQVLKLVDVGKNDCYSLVWCRQSGVTLYLNGKVQGHVADQGFAWAYMGIWLDAKKARDQSLQRSLLGNRVWP